MATTKKHNYLVFEATQPDIHNIPEYRDGRPVTRQANLYPYTCIGAVKATDVEEAVKGVMAVTRRIGKYAVIECDIVDFTTPFAEAESERPYELNP